MAMHLGNMRPHPKARKAKSRIGRGESSGHGKTGGRGGKGQTARSGSGGRADFEGGQTPIHRRLPKFGFGSLDEHRTDIGIVNLQDLNRFPANTLVDLAKLKESGLVRSRVEKVRVLGKGQLKHAVHVKANYFTQGALEKIKAVSGQAEVL